jgi:hypothetical protein
MQTARLNGIASKTWTASAQIAFSTPESNCTDRTSPDARSCPLAGCGYDESDAFRPAQWA